MWLIISNIQNIELSNHIKRKSLKFHITPALLHYLLSPCSLKIILIGCFISCKYPFDRPTSTKINGTSNIKNPSFWQVVWLIEEIHIHLAISYHYISTKNFTQMIQSTTFNKTIYNHGWVTSQLYDQSTLVGISPPN